VGCLLPVHLFSLTPLHILIWKAFLNQLMFSGPRTSSFKVYFFSLKNGWTHGFPGHSRVAGSSGLVTALPGPHFCCSVLCLPEE
jgi:hypothetical protein